MASADAKRSDYSFENVGILESNIYIANPSITEAATTNTEYHGLVSDSGVDDTLPSPSWLGHRAPLDCPVCVHGNS